MVLIVSWNVAGLRAFLKKDEKCGLKIYFEGINPDIICLQETKCSPEQIILPEYITEKYPYRFWSVNPGTTQRKGLSGVCTWSKKPSVNLDSPDFDTEGRICTVEFEDYIIVNVYTPNSQCYECPRYFFRINEWDSLFSKYILELNSQKPTIVCGDLNVVSDAIDYFNYKKNANTMPALFYTERTNFKKMLEFGYIDAYRHKHTDTVKFSHWSFYCKSRPKNGWRLDYFLVPKSLQQKIEDSDIHDYQYGSDHCPVTLKLF